MNQYLIITVAVVVNKKNDLIRGTEHGRFYSLLLAWMWTMIFSVSFLSIFQFGILWIAHLLIIAGVFLTMAAFEHTKKTQSLAISDDTQNFGHSTKCVWKLDAEA